MCRIDLCCIVRVARSRMSFGYSLPESWLFHWYRLVFSTSSGDRIYNYSKVRLYKKLIAHDDGGRGMPRRTSVARVGGINTIPVKGPAVCKEPPSPPTNPTNVAGVNIK